MIVDDDPNLVEASEMMLESYGFEIITAFDGEPAVEEFKNLLKKKCCSNCSVLNFIIMDCNMGKMGGLEASKIIKDLIKKDENLEHIPIIALTAYDLEEVKKLDEGKSMDVYLNKPITIDKLKKVVDQFI